PEGVAYAGCRRTAPKCSCGRDASGGARRRSASRRWSATGPRLADGTAARLGRVRLTVLGGGGAFPEPGGACSGFLVEQDGFRLLLDVGYATVPRLLRHVGAEGVDAVLVSHGHPDHCADLNPLLRARVMREHPAPALPVYAVPGALDPVLAL